MSRFEIQLDLGENYHDPYDFVEAAVFAEQLGYKKAWLGDHFFPWFHSAKKSAFVWSVLGVALEKTRIIKLGPLVSTPIGARYHPAIIAQASATIDNMYPGRFLLGLGTGEAINERPFLNDKWPTWGERIERLAEAISLIRDLFEKDEPFSFSGRYFHSDFYYLYTKPKTKIPIYFSALGKNACYHAGKYADHLVTMSPRNTSEKLRTELLPAYEKGCKDAGRNRGEVVICLSCSLGTPDEVWASSRNTLGFMAKDSWSLKTPIEVEKRGKALTIDELRRSIHFCRNWDDLIATIQGYIDIGATGAVLYTGPDRRLMQEYARNLLPVF
jgi:coenzyme F420-dependent glucose-6-phosphate dehydrogenase